ncbi:DUF3152 domain-containing protein [Streptomyces sp. NPDC059071]|uniref:DUF3152 domain-containing protein n=1 Tax=unclassified Streptomyces TaxID=2593676 RepID=UPI00364BCE69
MAPQTRTAPASQPAPPPQTGPRPPAGFQAPTPQQSPRPYGPQGHGRQGYAPQGYGTPAHGTPAYDGTPAHGTPMYDGTPAHGIPAYGAQAPRPAPVFDTPMHGTPRYQGPYEPDADGSFVRGGHPVHDETGETAVPAAPYIPGPRREAPPRRPGEQAEGPAGAGTGAGTEEAAGERPPTRSGGVGRTLTGIAAAAITTVLAVVVAGQVAERGSGGAPQAHAADDPADRAGVESPASRSDDRPARTPSAPPSAPPTYEQLMARQFPIDPKLHGSGRFEAVPGFDKAPGKGRKIRYRVDVEQGLGLDGALFAQAVQKTLNDRRSWAGNGEMTFERISSGEPEWVITLASPGTTGDWCRKSGLDTTVDNVSCDSASTDRVMINAFRWAQGSDTFGPDAMHAYRQMLINHEVGHRLGHSHVSCRTPGALAPVMQQQTKSLDIEGIECRPNPWVHPGS